VLALREVEVVLFEVQPPEHWDPLSVPADTGRRFEVGRYNRAQFGTRAQPGKPAHIPLAAPRTP
jgi:hypothetical protein